MNNAVQKLHHFGRIPREPQASEADVAALRSRAKRVELFAYPLSRQFPWATTALLAACGSISAATALYWSACVCRSESVDELRPRVRTFAKALSAGTVSLADLEDMQLHRLFTVSLCHFRENFARGVVNVVVFFCCGTLLERLRGPSFVFAAAVGAAVASNALALLMHEPSISSTSGSVAAMGTYCWLRHGHWAVWPGVPVPLTWLMAPILVSDLTAFAAYPSQLKEYRAILDSKCHDVTIEGGCHEITAVDNITAAADIQGTVGAPSVEKADGMSGLELTVGLAACNVVLERARAACHQVPEDVLMWQAELEQAMEMALPPPPQGAFWADIAGAVLAIIFVGFTKGVR